jgi:hypothetical protein
MDNKILKSGVFLVLSLMLIIIMGMKVTANSDSVNYLKSTFLNQDPDPAKPGEYLELRWKIEKIGNDKISDIQFRFVEDYPFSFDGSDNPIKKVGSWFGNSDDDEFYTLYYKVKINENVIEDDYEIRVDFKTNNNDWIMFTKEDIRVDKKKEPVLKLGKIITSPKNLQSDSEDNEISIEIQNVGDDGAENVKVKLELISGFEPSYSYSNEILLGTIDAGETKSNKIYLDIDEEVLSQVYDTKLEVEYKPAGNDVNEYETIEIPFEIRVKPKPEFEVIEVLPDIEKIVPGSDVKLKFVVKNTGQKEANSVSIRAFKDSTQPFEFEQKSDYIGKLNPNEQGEAVLEMSVNADANIKKYDLILEIRAVDGSEVIITEKKFSINVEQGLQKEKVGEFNIGLAVFILVVIVASTVVGFMMGKKRSETVNTKKSEKRKG